MFSSMSPRERNEVFNISTIFSFKMVEKFSTISIRHVIPMDSKTECANYLRHCGYGSI
jgi:hypothetical protein